MLIYIFVTMISVLVICNAREPDQTFTMKEEEESNYLISTFPPSNFNSNSDRSNKYQFSLLSNIKMTKELLKIGRYDGELRTRIKIDRDLLCKQYEVCCESSSMSDSCFLDFRVVMKEPPQRNRKYYRCRLTIEDLNDNTPKFHESTITLNIPENVKIGMQYLLPTAEDLDFHQNSIQQYRLGSPINAGDNVYSRSFRLIQKPNGYLLQPRLEVTSGNLDREMQASVELRYCAIDGGIPSKEGCANIVINLLDTNDNYPNIERTSLNVLINSSASSGDVIGQIRASDKDIDQNAQLNFHLGNLATKSIRSQFTIDRHTGQIRLLEPASNIISQANLVTIPIVVSDSGQPVMSTSATLSITVLPANDHAPDITVSPLIDDDSAYKIASIYENTQQIQTIAFVYVKDRDRNDFGQFSCKLQDESYFQLVVEYDKLQSNEKEYKIESKISLDREKIGPTIQLKIICIDHGIPQKQSMKIIPVNILNVNDNPPVFETGGNNGPIELRVFEGYPPGTVIGRLNVTDLDDKFSLDHLGNRIDNLKSKIKCSISDDSGYIGINEYNCELKALKMLDREALDKIVCIVKATDESMQDFYSSRPSNPNHNSRDLDAEKPFRSSSIQVNIYIMDKNDNTPKFEKSIYHIKIMENKKPDIVKQLIAQDLDSGQNGRVIYRLNYFDSATKTAFQIDPNTGNLRTKINLDRETHSKYKFRVVASDCGMPRLSATAVVHVTVEDENDNDPYFIYPRKANRSHEYSLFNRKGTPLIKLTANDLDDLMNKQILYGIIYGNKDGIFQLDPTNGQIYLARNLNKQDEGTYRLKIEARDAGIPPRSTTNIIILKFSSKITTILPSPSSKSASSSSLDLYQKRYFGNDEGYYGNENEDSILYGKNIVLIICVICVGLLSIFVFIVMVHFLRRKQQEALMLEGMQRAPNCGNVISRTDMYPGTIDDTLNRSLARKGENLIVQQDQINITNNNLWNNGPPTYSSLQNQTNNDDEYLPLAVAFPAEIDPRINTSYQTLVKQNDSALFLNSTPLSKPITSVPLSSHEPVKLQNSRCSTFTQSPILNNTSNNNNKPTQSVTFITLKSPQNINTSTTSNTTTVPSTTSSDYINKDATETICTSSFV